MANKLVGQNYQTPDLIAKVTGRAKYADDYKVDGMLHARLLTSPLPHARARNIDVSRALALPGVKGALLQQLDRRAEARAAFDRAIALANTPAEAAHIRQHLDHLDKESA